ncbi:MAG: O-antigen ligase family protein [Polyangiaceae bacterium]
MGLAIIVLGSMLALGAYHPETMSSIALVSAGLWLWLLRERPLPRVNYVSLVLMALASWCLLQLIPIPIALMEHVAPRNAELWKNSLATFGAAPRRWAPLSLDPGATWIEVLRWSTYAVVAELAHSVVRQRGSSAVAGIIFASSLILAVTTIAHGLSDASKVFGIYSPRFGSGRWHMGPLLNANHQAGYMTLGVLCGLGLVIVRDPPVPRWVPGLGVSVLVASIVSTGSRGGVLALVIGVVVFVAGALWFKRGGANAVGLVGLVGLVGAVLTWLGLSRNSQQELSDRGLEKLALARDTLPMIRDYAWLGAGRGAFQSVFPNYALAPGNALFTHPENVLLQWASEWGTVATAGALLALLVGAFRLGHRGFRRSIPLAVACAVFALVVHDLVDFSMEMPAVAIAVAASLGSLSRTRSVPRLVPWIPVVLIAIALPFGLSVGRQTPQRDRDSVYAVYAGREPDRAMVDKVKVAAREAMERHPADPYFCRVVGEVELRARLAPMPWLDVRSLEDPLAAPRTCCFPHPAASRSSKSGALEARLAVTHDPSVAPMAAVVIVRGSASVEEIWSAIPDGPAGVPLILEVSRLIKPKPATALLASALERNPSSLSAAQQLHLRLGELVRSDPSMCKKDRCTERMLSNARAARQTHPDRWVPLVWEAEALALSGKGLEGYELLSQCGEFLDHRGCSKVRLELARQTGDQDAVSVAATEFVQASCQTERSCATAREAAGDILAEMKDWGGAATYYRASASGQPSAKIWLKLADAELNAGARVRAREALEAARRRGGDSGKIARIERLLLAPD